MMEDTADYRPVSRWAIAAAAVGSCSALALVTRFAWWLPLVGVVLAVAALADVARPAAAKAGRLAALAGLALSLGFGAQAVTATLVDRWILGRRAVAAAGMWIDAVRAGRQDEALGISAPSVLPGSGGPRGRPEEEERADRAARFAAHDVVRAVAACGATRPTILGAAPVGSDASAWEVRAALDGCGADDATLRVVVESRTGPLRKGAVERWMITAFDLER